MNCLETALAAHAMGYPICITPPGEKGPRGTAWQLRRYSREEIEAKFKRKPEPNVGLILGPSASGLVDLNVMRRDQKTISRNCSVGSTQNALLEVEARQALHTPI